MQIRVGLKGHDMVSLSYKQATVSVGGPTSVDLISGASAKNVTGGPVISLSAAGDQVVVSGIAGGAQRHSARECVHSGAHSFT